MPPREFVERLCRGKYPSVAIFMFEKRSPWTRAFVRMREIDAVNTLGGPASDQPLQFGEELILLYDTRGNAKEIQVSGGGYFVLRWDGTCSTVSADEVAHYPPTAPQNALVVWKYLDEAIQEALLQDTTVKNAQVRQRDACHGARPGQGGASCLRANQILNDSIVLAVRMGIELPKPEQVP